jgi:hypothetical protein
VRPECKKVMKRKQKCELYLLAVKSVFYVDYIPDRIITLMMVCFPHPHFYSVHLHLYYIKILGENEFSRREYLGRF